MLRRPDGRVIFHFDSALMQNMMLEAVNPNTTVNYQKWLASEKYIRGMMRSV